MNFKLQRAKYWIYAFFLRAVENVQRKLAKTKESLRQRIEYMYPVLSRIQPWMRNKLRSAEVNNLCFIRVMILLMLT